MPALGAMFVTMVTNLVAFLLKYMSQKIAITLVLVTIFTTLSAGVYFAMRTAISAAVSFSASYHPMFGAGVAVVVSPHTATLVTSYVAFWSLCELYKWKMSIMFLWNRTSW